MCVGAGVAYYLGQGLVDQFRAGSKAPIVAAALPILNAPAPKPAALPTLKESETILLIGADKRYTNPGRGNSDTMMLVRVDPVQKTVSLLSLPRDLRVDIPGYGYAKLNAAYAYGGPALTIKTIRDLTGVTINHFVQIDMGGFDSLVNDLGGVYLPIDQRYFHISDGDWSSINLQPGYQLLSGPNALEWVRFRHLDSDFYRVARQQIFLREVARQLKANVTNPTAIYPILSDLAKATTSDISNLSQLTTLANTLREVPPGSINRVTVPATGAVIDGIDYEEASTQDIQDALNDWANPGWRFKEQHIASAKRKTPKAGAPASPTAGAPMAATAEGDSLLSPYEHQLNVCAPQQLPEGFYWGTPDTARIYKLAGHPAVAAWATESSGNSVLWMWTTWQNPPILTDPSQRLRLGRRTYDLYYDSGKLRMVSWNLGHTVVWVTNTLLNDLTDAQMLSLATNCKPL